MVNVIPTDITLRGEPAPGRPITISIRFSGFGFGTLTTNLATPPGVVKETIERRVVVPGMRIEEIEFKTKWPAKGQKITVNAFVKQGLGVLPRPAGKAGMLEEFTSG